MCFRKHNILYPVSEIIIRIPEKESGVITEIRNYSLTPPSATPATMYLERMR